MKRTPINKLGKIGEVNREAREIIAELCQDNDLTSCELRFKGCLGTYGVAPAHRKFRVNYSSVEELSDFNEWVVACVRCHTILDDRSLTTQEESNEIFLRLRGHEN